MIPDFMFNLYRGYLKLTGRDVVDHPEPYSPPHTPSLNEKSIQRAEPKPANKETVAELELTRRQKDYYLRQLLQRFGYGAKTGTSARIPHFEFDITAPDLLPQLEALYEFHLNAEILQGLVQESQSTELHRMSGFRAVDLASAAMKCSESRTLLLLVEPLGGRVAGRRGKISEDRRSILLEPRRGLNRVNPGMDTIYIGREPGAGPETLNYLDPLYRIESVKGRKLELDRPVPASLGSKDLIWNIPAAFGPNLEPKLEYKFDPGCRPHPHYDGVLFIIREGCVVAAVRASTGLTASPGDDLSLPSIRELDVVSHSVSGNARLNFAFELLDVLDSAPDARRYFMCHGNKRARGSGSENWLHSPEFSCVRDELIRAYGDNHARDNLEPDGRILSLLELDQRAARARFHRERRKGLEFWNGKIRSRLVILNGDNPLRMEDGDED